MRARHLALSLLTLAPAAGAQYRLVDEFTPAGLSPSDQLGVAVAASIDWIVYGAPGDDAAGQDAGAAYVQAQTFGGFTQKLVATTGAAGDQMGGAVEVYLDRIAVGMSRTSTNERSVWIFDAVTGAQVFELQAPVPSADDEFGATIGLSDQFVLVGAPGDDEVAAESGAIYVFSAKTGAFLSKHKATQPIQFGAFGNDVGLDGNIAVVGAPGHLAGQDGEVYMYDLTVDQFFGTIQSPCGCNGGFGYRVAVDVPRVLVLSPGDERAYVFPLNGGTPLEILPPGPGAGFGMDLALSGSRLVVSAATPASEGTAYVYSSDDGRLLDELAPPDAQTGDLFGYSVALAVWGAVIGSPGHDHAGAQAGAGYGYEPSGCPKNRYCSPAAKNSTGWSGGIDLDGCALGGSLVVRADHLPTSQFGYLLVGNGTGVVHPAGSVGTLCLGGSTPGIGRYVADVANTGSAGALETDLVFGNTGQGTGKLPSPPGGTLSTGQTWNFQYWYRDQGSSNFTDAITVLLQ